MRSGQRTFGALTLERQGASFDEGTVKFCEFAAMLAGPVLALKRDNERGPLARCNDGIRRLATRLLGPGFPRWKLGTLAAVLLSAGLILIRADYRLSSEAILEGSVQRVVVAAQDGYIASAGKRPGDLVRQGEPLGGLDDRDLRLEAVKWTHQ